MLECERLSEGFKKQVDDLSKKAELSGADYQNAGTKLPKSVYGEFSNAQVEAELKEAVAKQKEILANNEKKSWTQTINQGLLGGIEANINYTPAVARLFKKEVDRGGKLKRNLVIKIR